MILKMSKIEDYPRNYPEFLARFKEEGDCWLRWPTGFKCRKCGVVEYYVNNRKVIECGGCGHQSSATSGTMLTGQESHFCYGFT
jgi:hypothetical protein